MPHDTSSPRRRLVRPTADPPRSPCPLRLQKLRTRLGQERATLAHWMARLRRAFHTVERTQQRIARLERQVTRLKE
jgi:hypothetical protein